MSMPVLVMHVRIVYAYILWLGLDVRLASDYKNKLRSRAKFFRLPNSPCYSLKVLRNENVSFPVPSGLNQGNNHRSAQCDMLTWATAWLYKREQGRKARRWH